MVKDLNIMAVQIHEYHLVYKIKYSFFFDIVNYHMYSFHFWSHTQKYSSLTPGSVHRGHSWWVLRNIWGTSYKNTGHSHAR